MDIETRERIERLRALRNPNPTDERDVAQAYLGADVFSPIAAIKLRDSLIDLLERSDPDGWADEQLGEYGLVRLPRDKDGECIHVGDTVCDMRGNVGTVSEVRINRDSSRNTISVLHHENNEFEAYFPMGLTHRLPVTVESVLRELLDVSLQDLANAARENGMSYSDWISSSNDAITECAKRLRLAEVDE